MVRIVRALSKATTAPAETVYGETFEECLESDKISVLLDTRLDWAHVLTSNTATIEGIKIAQSKVVAGYWRVGSEFYNPPKDYQQLTEEMGFHTCAGSTLPTTTTTTSLPSSLLANASAIAKLENFTNNYLANNTMSNVPVYEHDRTKLSNQTNPNPHSKSVTSTELTHTSSGGTSQSQPSSDGASQSQPGSDGASQSKPNSDGAIQSQLSSDGASQSQPSSDGASQSQPINDSTSQPQAGGEKQHKTSGNDTSCVTALPSADASSCMDDNKKHSHGEQHSANLQVQTQYRHLTPARYQEALRLQKNGRVDDAFDCFVIPSKNTTVPVASSDQNELLAQWIKTMLEDNTFTAEDFIKLHCTLRPDATEASCTRSASPTNSQTLSTLPSPMHQGSPDLGNDMLPRHLFTLEQQKRKAGSAMPPHFLKGNVYRPKNHPVVDHVNHNFKARTAVGTMASTAVPRAAKGKDKLYKGSLKTRLLTHLRRHDRTSSIVNGTKLPQKRSSSEIIASVMSEQVQPSKEVQLKDKSRGLAWNKNEVDSFQQQKKQVVFTPTSTLPHSPSALPVPPSTLSTPNSALVSQAHLTSPCSLSDKGNKVEVSSVFQPKNRISPTLVVSNHSEVRPQKQVRPVPTSALPIQSRSSIYSGPAQTRTNISTLFNILPKPVRADPPQIQTPVTLPLSITWSPVHKTSATYHLSRSQPLPDASSVVTTNGMGAGLFLQPSTQSTMATAQGSLSVQAEPKNIMSSLMVPVRIPSLPPGFIFPLSSRPSVCQVGVEPTMASAGLLHQHPAVGCGARSLLSHTQRDTAPTPASSPRKGRNNQSIRPHQTKGRNNQSIRPHQTKGRNNQSIQPHQTKNVKPRKPQGRRSQNTDSSLSSIVVHADHKKLPQTKYMYNNLLIKQPFVSLPKLPQVVYQVACRQSVKIKVRAEVTSPKDECVKVSCDNPTSHEINISDDYTPDDVETRGNSMDGSNIDPLRGNMTPNNDRNSSGSSKKDPSSVKSSHSSDKKGPSSDKVPDSYSAHNTTDAKTFINGTESSEADSDSGMGCARISTRGKRKAIIESSDDETGSPIKVGKATSELLPPLVSEEEATAQKMNNTQAVLNALLPVIFTQPTTAPSVINEPDCNRSTHNPSVADTHVYPAKKGSGVSINEAGIASRKQRLGKLIPSVKMPLPTPTNVYSIVDPCSSVNGVDSDDDIIVLETNPKESNQTSVMLSIEDL